MTAVKTVEVVPKAPLFQRTVVGTRRSEILKTHHFSNTGTIMCAQRPTDDELTTIEKYLDADERGDENARLELLGALFGGPPLQQ